MIFKQKTVRWLAIAVLLCAVVVGVVLYFTLKPSGSSPKREYEEMLPWVLPKPQRAKGAVVSNGGPCADIGMAILKKYGNAVDSLIATMLCDGITCMHNMGIGGGFLATLYIKKENKIITLNSREAAPLAATEDMFVSNKSLSYHGGLAVAVPGEIRGYWEMYQKYGGAANWSELFEGTIKLCEEGVPVNPNLARNIVKQKEFILNTPQLRDLLLKANGELPVYGDTIKLPKLAKTFRIIAKEGVDAIYNGSLTDSLISDIKSNGGIITREDMTSYSALWEEPEIVELSSGYKIYSSPSPGSGPILSFIMKLLDGQLPSKQHELNTTFMITEAFKFAYSMRSKLGDSSFVNNTAVLNLMKNESYISEVRRKLNAPKTSNNIDYYGANYIEEDHGTANTAVYAPNGDAVTATSTINTIFGSGVVSQSTGILLNNEMDDFSTPGLVNYFGVSPSSENFIAPKKRPMSSMCPAIITDKNGVVKLIIGAAGGTKITTSTALAMIWNLIYNKTTAEAVDEPRFHHQLMPMTWSYEPLVDKDIMEGMKNRGHVVTETTIHESCVTAISVNEEILGASSDMRRPGNTSYLSF